MTNPAHDRDERHRVDFLVSNFGKVVWAGIRSDDKEVHGHGFWLVGKLDRTPGGTMCVWIRRDAHAGWKRVALANIVRAAEEEPGPKHRDYMREFDQGLSPAPKIDDILAEASRHQLDGDAGTR